MQRRRQHYRVTDDFIRVVELELLGPKVHARNVKMINLSSGGCAVQLPAGASGLLRQRDIVDLRVISKRLKEAIEMNGRIAWLDESSKNPSVGITFLNWREHRRLLDSDLRELFNEREAFRVAPPTSTPTTVSLSSSEEEGEVAEGNLRDISTMGLSLSIPAELAKGLPELSSVLVRISLDDDSPPITTRADIRYVTDHEGSFWAKVGIEFSQESSQTPEDRKSLRDFIMKRQRKSIRLSMKDEKE